MKLASFQKVTSVQPIDGADKIVKIIVDGHELVTQKTNNLKEGDIVCYFAVDAMLPTDSTFEWLVSNLINSTGGEGYRITPRKTKGIVSDGLCLPLSYFEETSMGKILAVLTWLPEEHVGFDSVLKFYSSGNSYPIREGEDLTKALNVWKFEEKV